MKRSRLASSVVLLGLVTGTLTCGDVAAPHTEPTSMRPVADDGQTAAIGTVLPAPLVILVVDADSNQVPGVRVTWEARGGGSVSSTSVETDQDGHVTVRRTLGPVIGYERRLRP